MWCERDGNSLIVKKILKDCFQDLMLKMGQFKMGLKNGVINVGNSVPH